MINPDAIELYRRYQSAEGEEAEWLYLQYLAALRPPSFDPQQSFGRGVPRGDDHTAEKRRSVRQGT